jgi:2-amino-4-hydroxy-6-hydroxymethyldihydropteridine diphosphokinase
MILLGLGTNLGDRRAQLSQAIAGLGQIGTVGAISHLYESAPMYVLDQPSFYNLCLEFSSTLSPVELLHAVKSIERIHGRTDGPRNGPRVIDIDIISFGDEILHLPDLIIPHPRLAERGFVLAPLADIAPDLILPGYDATIAALLARCDVSGIADLGTFIR